MVCAANSWAFFPKNEWSKGALRIHVLYKGVLVGLERQKETRQLRISKHLGQRLNNRVYCPDLLFGPGAQKHQDFHPQWSRHLHISIVSRTTALFPIAEHLKLLLAGRTPVQAREEYQKVKPECRATYQVAHPAGTGRADLTPVYWHPNANPLVSAVSLRLKCRFLGLSAEPCPPRYQVENADE